MRANVRDVVFVIGMHRSGTSAFARVLSLCGGALPLRVMPANYANPSGFWEPQAAVDLNDLFLNARGSSWSDASFDFQASAQSSNLDDAFVSLIADFFDTGFQAAGPMVLKEPRITILLPYWIAAARRRGLGVKVIHVFRHPRDVASSLAERDGLALGRALALWSKYNVIGELEARGTRRVFVSYEELMQDWQAVVARCADQLELDITLDARAQAAVAGFLSPQLHHHTAALRDPASFTSPIFEPALRLHGVLQRAARGELDTTALEAIRADTHRFVDANAAIYALAAAERDMRVLDIGPGRGELSYAFAAAGARVTAIHDSRERFAEMRAALGELPVRVESGAAAPFSDRAGYDVAVASTAVEELPADDRARLFDNVARRLRPAGSLIVHTAARRDTGRSPVALRWQLRSAFEHVCLWVAAPDDSRGSLARPFTEAEQRAATDVFAVASNAPLDAGVLLRRLTAAPLAQ